MPPFELKGLNFEGAAVLFAHHFPTNGEDAAYATCIDPSSVDAVNSIWEGLGRPELGGEFVGELIGKLLASRISEIQAEAKPEKSTGFAAQGWHAGSKDQRN